MTGGKDFFVSYNKADRAWAEWIAWQLEGEGFTTTIQAWDFRPGTNFVSRMHEAAKEAARTIAVLSPDYLEHAPFSEAEWAAAFVQDPTGDKGLLLPVRVRDCDPAGLLKAIVYINLVNLDESVARTTLLAGIQRTRAKPSTSPHFPGATAKPPTPTPSPAFPGRWPLTWNVPYERNPYFTGRAKLLQSLRDQLASGNTMALTQAQAGGIGKTQTAIEYAYRYRQQYRSVLWISAATPEALLSDFVALADILGMPGQKQQITASIIKDYLAQQRDWLLIFDNADDIEMIRPLLPFGNNTNGHILLTTRAQALGTFAHAIRVEEMDAEEGTHLLLKRGKVLKMGELSEKAKGTARADAEAMVAAVGGLPLAIDQAAAYIEETGCSLADYLKIYQSRHRLELLKRRGRLATDHPEAVATTWSLSFQKVEEENKAAAELLRLCAFLAPDAIPEELISEGASELGEVLGPVAADLLLFNDAMDVLRKYSLVKRDADTKTLIIHRLVQEVLKDGMNEEVRKQWAERAVRAVSKVFPFGWDVKNWPLCRRLLSQAQFCEQLIVQYDMVFAEAARLLLCCGYYLFQQALYGLIEPFFLRALHIAEKLDGSVYPATYNVQHGLAMLYGQEKKHEQAEHWCKKALEAEIRLLGEEDSNTIATQHQLAILYQEQGKYEEAEQLYQQALKTKLQVLGEQHPNTASTQHALARLYQDRGKYDEAEQLYQQALKAQMRVLGQEHPSTAITQHNSANLYQDQGKYEEAEQLYQQALKTERRVLGEEHPNTAATQHELARLYREQGRYEEAEQLYQQALKTRLRVLGEEHPYTAITQRSLANLLRKMGRRAEAEALEARIKKKDG